MYNFIMPYPPTVNHYHQPIRMGKGARITKGVKAREYAKVAAEHLKGLGLDGEQLDKRLSVALIINPPTLRKYDIDNRTKGVFDALSDAGFWLDDEQVDRLTIKKGEKTKGGNVEVTVSIIS